MDILPILTLFLARLLLGYTLCLGVIGPMVPAGPWPKVSLFVIAGLALVNVTAGAPFWPFAALALAALLLERGRLFGLAWAQPWLLAPFGAWAALAREWPPTLATLLGGMAAGGTLASMLLGHSYLTARGLSFDPLRRLTTAVLAVIALRAVAVLPAFFGDHPMGDWIFLSARAAFGLFLPLVFGWMVVQCVKIRSNQSATGILYAMTALVGGGEMIAAFLQLNGGVAA